MTDGRPAPPGRMTYRGAAVAYADEVGQGRDAVGEQLAEWGRVILLETRGRITGRAIVTPVGFVERADGALLVAAADEHTDWARNLRVDPGCSATREGRTSRYRATELDGHERHQAIVELILRYGTPSERLGGGPAFRLDPVLDHPEGPSTTPLLQPI